MVRDYVGDRTSDDRTICKKIVRMAVASTANICIIPIQDYLGVDNHARINTPSTLGINWQWRLTEGEITEALLKEIKEISMIYGRSR